MIKKLHERLIHQYAQNVQLIILLLLLLVVFGRYLNPLNERMFLAHDETQAARIHQFNLNIQHGIIPPRIAPDFSFGLGYPVFNYYAPFPYWVAQFFLSIGFSILSAMKITYLLAILIGWGGMYLFLRRFFPFYPSLLGSFLYSTSPYLAVDIFIRANLGETWVFALLPLALYFLLTNNSKRILLTAIILSCLFTAHNILSLISLGIILVFIFLTEKRLLNTITVAASLLLSSYFLVPAVTELSLVQARNIASTTQYSDHFLCITQIWTSLWGYAGSAPGCTQDGMSFMLGKIPILLGVMGMVLYLYKNHIYKNHRLFLPLHRSLIRMLNSINKLFPAFNQEEIIKSKELKRIAVLMLLVTIISLYLTLYASAWFWGAFSFLLSLFQFPWRFLMFTLFGISFFSAYLFSNGSRYAQIPATVGIILVILLIHPKYFSGQMISYDEFTLRYLTEKYIHGQVAYKVPEYVPHTVNVAAWKKLETDTLRTDTTPPVVGKLKKDILLVDDQPFAKMFMVRSSDPVIAQIHYAPYWKIVVDYIDFIPTKFDKLGRPYIPVSSTAYTSIQIRYEQTTIEQIANLLSLSTLGILLGFTVRQYFRSWNIIKKT